jgi:hypothetical protein
MANAHLFTSPDDAKRFIYGGRAVVTIESEKTGMHYTYKISQKTDDDGKKTPFFVSLLTGPDNTNDFTYIGVLGSDGAVKTTKKSSLTAESVPVRALGFVTKHIVEGRMPPQALVRHEGKCGCCGGALTVPESIDRGIGPECWSKLGGG